VATRHPFFINNQANHGLRHCLGPDGSAWVHPKFNRTAVSIWAEVTRRANANAFPRTFSCIDIVRIQFRFHSSIPAKGSSAPGFSISSILPSVSVSTRYFGLHARTLGDLSGGTSELEESCTPAKNVSTNERIRPIADTFREKVRLTWKRHTLIKAAICVRLRRSARLLASSPCPLLLDSRRRSRGFHCSTWVALASQFVNTPHDLLTLRASGLHCMTWDIDNQCNAREHEIDVSPKKTVPISPKLLLGDSHIALIRRWSFSWLQMTGMFLAAYDVLLMRAVPDSAEFWGSWWRWRWKELVFGQKRCAIERTLYTILYGPPRWPTLQAPHESRGTWYAFAILIGKREGPGRCCSNWLYRVTRTLTEWHALNRPG